MRINVLLTYNSQLQPSAPCFLMLSDASLLISSWLWDLRRLRHFMFSHWWGCVVAKDLHEGRMCGKVKWIPGLKNSFFSLKDTKCWRALVVFRVRVCVCVLNRFTEKSANYGRRKQWKKTATRPPDSQYMKKHTNTQWQLSHCSEHSCLGSSATWRRRVVTERGARNGGEKITEKENKANSFLTSQGAESIQAICRKQTTLLYWWKWHRCVSAESDSTSKRKRKRCNREKNPGDRWLLRSLLL